MDVFTTFAFGCILCSSFYITCVNSCLSRSRTNTATTVSPWTGTLDYYDADNDQRIVCGWHEMLTTSMDEGESMILLEEEARNTADKPCSRMHDYLERAKTFMSSNTPVDGLTRAECLVVIMYTDDNDVRAFFKEYTMASKSAFFQPYKVFTTLLVSALRKLSIIDPIPQGAVLFRGISYRPEEPRARRIFWKAFTSTSLQLSVAECFVGSAGSILEFRPPATRLAARVRLLSNYPLEDEVLLLPFEAFNFWNVTNTANGPRFYFTSSESAMNCNQKDELI